MTHHEPYRAQLGELCHDKRQVAKLNADYGILVQESKARFYISFYLDERRKGHWPILFPTRELAERAMKVLPIFQNKHIAGIQSASVQRTNLP